MIWVKPWFSDHADYGLAEDGPLESSKDVNNPNGDRKYNNRPPTLVNPFFDKHQFLWLFIDAFTLSHRMTLKTFCRTRVGVFQGRKETSNMSKVLN